MAWGAWHLAPSHVQVKITTTEIRSRTEPLIYKVISDENLSKLSLSFIFQPEKRREEAHPSARIIIDLELSLFFRSNKIPWRKAFATEAEMTVINPLQQLCLFGRFFAILLQFVHFFAPRSTVVKS